MITNAVSSYYANLTSYNITSLTVTHYKPLYYNCYTN